MITIWWWACIAISAVNATSAAGPTCVKSDVDSPLTLVSSPVDSSKLPPYPATRPVLTTAWEKAFGKTKAFFNVCKSKQSNLLGASTNLSWNRDYLQGGYRNCPEETGYSTTEGCHRLHEISRTNQDRAQIAGCSTQFRGDGFGLDVCVNIYAFDWYIRVSWSVLIYWFHYVPLALQFLVVIKKTYKKKKEKHPMARQQRRP